MNLDERRLLVGRAFDRAVQTVLDAFLHEGFTITAVDAGDLHKRSRPGCPLRYALLEATLPELTTKPGASVTAGPLPSCRLSVFELNGSCTLVTAENWLVRYPLLAPLARRNGDRIGDALRSIIRRELPKAA